MDLELLDCAGSEVVASGEENRDLLLLEEVGDLRQCSRLPDAVDTDESDDVGSRAGPGLDGLLEDIDGALGRENLLQ